MGVGPRFGTKIKSISRYGLNFYLQLKKKKKKKTTHQVIVNVIVFLMLNRSP